jgi:hypothetical protein
LIGTSEDLTNVDRNALRCSKRSKDWIPVGARTLVPLKGEMGVDQSIDRPNGETARGKLCGGRASSQMSERRDRLIIETSPSIRIRTAGFSGNSLMV